MNASTRWRTLIVDGDPVTGQQLGERVARLGYETVGLVATSEELDRFADERAPHLLLMAVHAPLTVASVDRASELARRLGERWPLPIVVVADEDGAELAPLVASTGQGNCLVHPFTDAALARSLKVALVRHDDLARLRRLNAELQAANARLQEEAERRRRAEDAAQVSDSTFRAIAEHAPDAFLRFGRDGSCLFVSPNLDARIGFSATALLGKPIGELAGESRDQRRQLGQALTAVFETGTTQELELTIGGEHRRRIVSLRLAPEIDADGQPSTALAVCRDVTQLKEAEVALLRTQQCTAVGTLAGGIAHQFNNLHAIIMGNADLLLADEALDDRAKGRLLRIRRTVERATDVVRKLATLSRQIHLRQEDVAPRELVRETVSVQLEAMRQEGIQLKLELAPTRPIHVDRVQMQTVIANLVSNACHAMLDQPRRELILRTREHGNQVVIQVEDTGCGIAPENLDRVFLPFYSTKGEHAGEGSPQARVRGTGLGLSVCEAVVTSQGGTLSVSSSVGQGTIFTLSLPAVTTSEPSLDLVTELVTEVSHGRVLVVDDEPLIRLLMSESLNEQQLEADAVASAREALDLLVHHPYDLLIVDLQLPGISGVELIRQVRERLIDGHQPAILVITGRLDPDDSQALAGLGVHHLLHKPFEMPALMQAVRHLLIEAEPAT